MIRIIKGTYGLRRLNKVEAMTPGTEPFSLSAEREKELVEQGTAEYVSMPETVVQEKANIPEESYKPEQSGDEKQLDNKNDRKKRK